MLYIYNTHIQYIYYSILLLSQLFCRLESQHEMHMHGLPYSCFVTPTRMPDPVGRATGQPLSSHLDSNAAEFNAMNLSSNFQ